LEFGHKEIQVLISLRLIVLIFPEPPEDGLELFIVGHG
jgi:hypothetical protein